MYQHSKNYFLTLVCALFFVPTFAHSAPSTDFPPDQISSGLHPTTNEPSTPSKDFTDATKISPAESSTPLPTNQEEPPILATRKLSNEASFVSVGLWSGSVVDNSQNDSITYFHWGKSVYDSADLATEYTLDLSTSSYFGWSAGYKFLQDLGKHYEPYLKIALAAFYSSNEKLGTFVNWQRYQIRGEVGCDDLFDRSRSLRAELGFSWSGFGGGLYLGASYAF